MEVLKKHRAEIDKLDDEIVKLLAKRYEIVAEVAKIKFENGIPASLPDRIEEVKNRNAQHAEELGLNGEFTKNLFTDMIDYAISFENQYMRSKSEEDIFG